MLFGSIISSPRGNLSLQQALNLANLYLKNAEKSTDYDICLVLCHDVEVSLSQVKKTIRKIEDEAMRERIAHVYIEVGRLLDRLDHSSEAQAFYKKSLKFGDYLNSISSPGPLKRSDSVNSELSSSPPKPVDIVAVSKDLFASNVRPPTIVFIPPEPDSRLNDTRQLACCLGLLQSPIELSDILDSSARVWLQDTVNDHDERERLKSLATDVIRAFKRDEFKDAKAVTEVVYLAPVLEKDDFRYLLKEFYSGIDQSWLLDVHQLEGLAHLIQDADTGYLDADDLIKILELLSIRFRDIHQQSTGHLYQLIVAVSQVLDAMADASVSGLDREKIHEPLSLYLNELKESPDAYLVYQAAYAYQALMCVPDDEALWQATLRRSGKAIQGVSGLVSAVKGLDLNGFIEGLGKIQEGLAGATKIVKAVKSEYDGAMSLGESGQGFFECLKEDLSFNRKCAWYTALRGADALILDGQFAEFKEFVYEAPCLRDAAFQWGICQRLGEVAASPLWDEATRHSAIALLVEIYQNDAVWGHHTTVKQWIMNILMQLSSLSGDDIQFVESQLQRLQKDGDATKQMLYERCRENGPGSYPLKVGLPEIGSPSLLDRVQERPDVEGSLRQLRRQRLRERENFVYIPPQAKSSLQALDDERFPLMEKVEEFLDSDQKVFLLVGDSGSGKSSFSSELECHLWREYKKNGVIPLRINLPAISKPEQDMIAKQLRKAEFTEPQIRELKMHRKFVLICDGYDESQQTHNLYISNRLNQPGEWCAKMVISCRSEHLGPDYKDRFQPGDRNNRSESGLFQEAVITPFSMDQVQDYITQYVSVHRPLWEADEYKNALDHIPSLKELVRNPFLMSLSLEVLPRMVDPGQDLSTTHITRMALYDQFIEHWFERCKKRLGERNLGPQARAAFESLIDEGFTWNGIDYLKKLCTAIYREQGGQPIVTYSRYKDENTWKAEFFSREEEIQILREACPLVRNGNQHQFIHRSLLEYGLALAIFDPQDLKRRLAQGSTLSRRRSIDSIISFDGYNTMDDISAIADQGIEPSLDSPLAWRRFVNELSVIQFLEERLKQEPMFKRLLFDYIERSKEDKKWRIAASNAITILVGAGVQFNNADLRGIQIPHADLSYGMFDSAHLQGADLRHVDLRGAWLRKANLGDTQMTGVQFGELPFLKHESQVSLCAYSSDGKTFAVGLDDGMIKVYSTSDWWTLWTLEGHRDRVTNMVFSPDNDRIASCSSDHSVRLWDVRTGRCIHTLNGYDDPFKSVAYSPQGDQIASASNEAIKVWDVESGECRDIWIGHSRSVLGVIYSPRGGQVASRSEDSTVRIWDVEAGRCRHILEGHKDSVTSLAYSPQGDQLASASASYDDALRLWDVATGECLHNLTWHSCILFVSYSPNGNQIASTGSDGSIQLWDTYRGACLHILQGHTDWVRTAAYSPQGDMIVSASDDRTLRLWDSTTGVCRQTLLGHSSEVLNVVISPRGDQVASSSNGTTVRLWDVGAGTSRYISSGHFDTVLGVNCSPRGDNVATCSSDTTVRLWDVETGECRQVLRGHSGAVTSVVYAPQGYQIATGGCDGAVRLWDVGTGACVLILEGHGEMITTIAYSPRGDRLASGGDNTVWIWDIKTGDCSYTLTGHSDMVLSIAYAPQGDHVVSASIDTMVRVWDVRTGDCRRILIGHNVPVTSVVYSPRGDQIISGGNDGDMKLWDTESGDCLGTLTGHSSGLNRIVYSPRGDLITSVSSGDSVRLWDSTSGQCRAAIRDFLDHVKDIAWVESSGVQYLVAGCEDGVVGAWQVLLDGDRCDISLKWMTTKGVLDVKDATIQGAQGLNQLYEKLLKQRGAVGEPSHRLLEASKKVATMASVVSKLKTPSSEVDSINLTANASVEQLEQWLEQAKGTLYQDIVAAIVKSINGYK
ncbi:MAG: WD40-repeat-containing domain protein [Benniella sp.]|nr:MAG: WD40-repeat-containing domain protein [Benniella sp.]